MIGMTDIPASIDQQAAQRLEEYGCWNEAGSLVGFIINTIRGLGLDAELMEDEETILGRNVCFVDIQVWPTKDSDWYWNVYVCLNTDKPVKYWVSARYKYDSDRSASLGIVDRFSAVLAIVCSGLTFKLPPAVDNSTMEYRHTSVAGTMLDTSTHLQLLREGAADAYRVGGCYGLSGYIRDTFMDMEFSVDILDGEFYHIEVSKGGAVTYVVIPVSNKDYGVYYKATSAYLYLGSVNSIAAVVAIVCGGATFYDDGEDSKALVDALENPPPPNEAMLKAAEHYKTTVTSEPSLEDVLRVYKQPTPINEQVVWATLLRAVVDGKAVVVDSDTYQSLTESNAVSELEPGTELRMLVTTGEGPPQQQEGERRSGNHTPTISNPQPEANLIYLPSGTTINPAFIEAVEYRIATPSYDGGYYLTLPPVGGSPITVDDKYYWSPTKVCLVVRFNSGHTTLYGGEDANAVWYHYHGEILYVDTREQYVVLEAPGIKVKVRPGPTYDWVSRAIVEDIELALAKLLVDHGYVDPKVLEDVNEGVAMLRFMKGRPSLDPSSGGLYLVRRGWDSPEPELLMACTPQD